ncbi:hypothetical protein [Aureibacillus halotolerans]|uniref:Uncharacterized protein n=1 Tax=Aureibacillus halotolerans TaxID=1508390 RepID=A0A4R6U941_9BACI|nr:hypothetical protein [Aureibacillus halotolerans]TDQ41483.1 hypothetical protein EV213_10361 [Aureibacillus halotolerans]
MNWSKEFEAFLKHCFSQTGFQSNAADQDWSVPWQSLFNASEAQSMITQVETNENYCTVFITVVEKELHGLSVLHSSSVVWIENQTSGEKKELRLPCLIKKGTARIRYKDEKLSIRWLKRVDPVLAQVNIVPESLTD